jgi:hypothetical protein
MQSGSLISGSLRRAFRKPLRDCLTYHAGSRIHHRGRQHEVADMTTREPGLHGRFDTLLLVWSPPTARAHQRHRHPHSCFVTRFRALLYC